MGICSIQTIFRRISNGTWDSYRESSLVAGWETGSESRYPSSANCALELRWANMRDEIFSAGFRQARS
jgi:hypothetical protein